MFSTLESNWDQSPRRGRAALASFAVQTFGLGLLIAISLLWVERPPQVHWLQISPPAHFVRVEPDHPIAHQTPTINASRLSAITTTFQFPLHPAVRSDADSGPAVANAPTIDNGSTDPTVGIFQSIGRSIPAVIPSRPAAAKPLVVSHWAEGNLIYRVQPNYPALARQARIQGAVELRAVISKAGTIEHLVVVRGHPMLSAAAIDAVRQWRYRPYLLNGDPIEVETDVTLNFLLSSN
jgi:periplasmic protein TonB